MILAARPFEDSGSASEDYERVRRYLKGVAERASEALTYSETAAAWHSAALAVVLDCAVSAVVQDGAALAAGQSVVRFLYRDNHMCRIQFWCHQFRSTQALRSRQAALQRPVFLSKSSSC